MDLHHNLFYSYRGPETDGTDRNRQLENNVTKALINTLQFGGATVWRPFLAELGIPDASDVRFLLQRRELPSGGAARKRCRVLLGISKMEPVLSRVGEEETIQQSVPDAWVYGDGFAVLIESKVGDERLSPRQMQSHCTRIRSGDDAAPSVVLKTWRDVHRSFRRFLPSLDHGAKLLVEQFVQYLEYIGMSGFTGFRHEHFDYFVLHDDEETRRWVRAQMVDFAARVQTRLQQFHPFYESYDIGSLKHSSAHCWAAFGPAKGRYRKVTHQTISLGSYGLQVFVNAELKEATDRLKTVLTDSPGALLRALRNAHSFEPFELVLQKREQRQASVYDCTPQLRLHSSLLADEAAGNLAWMALVDSVLHLPLLNLSIERLTPPQRLLKVSTHGESAELDLVVEMLEQNHPIVDLLNGSQHTPQ